MNGIKSNGRTAARQDSGGVLPILSQTQLRHWLTDEGALLLLSSCIFCTYMYSHLTMLMYLLVSDVLRNNADALCINQVVVLSHTFSVGMKQETLGTRVRVELDSVRAEESEVRNRSRFGFRTLLDSDGSASHMHAYNHSFSTFFATTKMP